MKLKWRFYRNIGMSRTSDGKPIYLDGLVFSLSKPFTTAFFSIQATWRTTEEKWRKRLNKQLENPNPKGAVNE